MHKQRARALATSATALIRGALLASRPLPVMGSFLDRGDSGPLRPFGDKSVEFREIAAMEERRFTEPEGAGYAMRRQRAGSVAQTRVIPKRLKSRKIAIGRRDGTAIARRYELLSLKRRWRIRRPAWPARADGSRPSWRRGRADAP